MINACDSVLPLCARPAVVSRKGPTWVEVIYDNGEVERVHADDIFPADVPVDFGMELLPLQVGEFVEVSNASSTDPGAWLGVVAAVGHVFRIDYPFHDSPSELVRVRAASTTLAWVNVGLHSPACCCD